MRRTFLSTGSPQTEDERYYVLQNWRQDAAVIIDEAAVQIERAQFSPYGRVFGMPAGDTNFDGAVNSTDTNLISAWNALSYPYRAYADVDLDGDVDAADASAANVTTMGWDVLSDIGSTIGYAGYVQDDYIPALSHVRHRVYKSDLGRWVQRDPAGYVDGANLYEYVSSWPLVYRDPSGLTKIREGLCCLKNCRSWQCVQGFRWADQAKRLTRRLPGQHNGEGDAVRHCVWSCIMQSNMGPQSKCPKHIGDCHEDEGDRTGQPAVERQMDEWNNRIGRGIGRYGCSKSQNPASCCDRECRKAWRLGRLRDINRWPVRRPGYPYHPAYRPSPYKYPPHLAPLRRYTPPAVSPLSPLLPEPWFDPWTTID